MARTVWNGAVIAESEETIVVEGNHYFPAASVLPEYLRPSTHHTVCGWKGRASYYDVVVREHANVNAAWYYREPKPEAVSVAGRIAFWKSVEVTPSL